MEFRLLLTISAARYDKNMFKGLHTIARRLAPALGAALLGICVAGCGSSSSSSASSGSTAAGTAGGINHVFVLVLENEDYSNSFGSSTNAPYLSTTLPTMGVLLQDFYSTGHNSNDNYISMISGQAPNLDNQLDCQTFSDFNETGTTSPGQAKGSGCVFPTSVTSLPDQLQAAGWSWKAYMEDMGNIPTRESATCGHPTVGDKDNTQTAVNGDQYATRHDPFVYFHSIIDDASYCDSHVVNLDDSSVGLAADLKSVSTTANFIFITPNLCHDGHDSPCVDGEPGGLTSINSFLQEWVPQITASPAFQQDGLLIITFDESNGPEYDSSYCCGEGIAPNTLLPGLLGLGGGKIGAVLLSPFIKAGTVSTTEYNHYSMLRSVEDLFGLDYLGYADGSGQASFGSDVYTQTMPVLPSKS
jgi:phosphatidylinositol-3-phosphatase